MTTEEFSNFRWSTITPIPDEQVREIFEVDLGSLRLQALQLFMAEAMKPGEYRGLIKMLYSPDTETHFLAQAIINQKIKEL